jgi:hypothetical protein
MTRQVSLAVTSAGAWRATGVPASLAMNRASSSVYQRSPEGRLVVRGPRSGAELGGCEMALGHQFLDQDADLARPAVAESASAFDVLYAWLTLSLDRGLRLGGGFASAAPWRRLRPVLRQFCRGSRQSSPRVMENLITAGSKPAPPWARRPAGCRERVGQGCRSGSVHQPSTAPSTAQTRENRLQLGTVDGLTPGVGVTSL